MNKRKLILPLIGGVLIVGGVACTLLTEGLDTAIPFALGLIAVVVGVFMIPLGLMKPKNKVDVRTLSMAALFAALCYVGFTYCKIDIPVGMEKTAFH